VIVQHEVAFALARNIPVVPLILKGTEASHLGFLEGLERIEFDASDPVTTLVNLTAGVTSVIATQSAGFAIHLDMTDPGTVVFVLAVGLLAGLYLAALLSEGERVKILRSFC
jgi:hypothetical protein